MEQRAGRETLLQSPLQRRSQFKLSGGQRGVVPLLPVHVIDGDESRFSALRKPHIAGHEFAVDLAAERFDGLPLPHGVRLGHARVFAYARDAH